MAIKPSGPCPATIMVVGEAPGKDEIFHNKPFMGASGQELRRMLFQAGLDPEQIFFSNVFMDRPEDNKIENFCGKKADVGKDYPYPAFSQGKYFLRERADPALSRLREEILACNPRVIIALGNTATWALLRRTAISKVRGNVFGNELIEGGPVVIPTYHPAAILRNWSDRPIVVTDLMKVKRYVEVGFSVPRRELWLEPTIEEFERFAEQHIFRYPRPSPLSFDVETKGQTVTCIGFSPRPDLSITVPFYDPGSADKSYWPTAELEKRAWLLVRKILESSIPKLGQNGLYDIQYCYRWGIMVKNYIEDTMIRHHALYPEMEKGLGFLGSVYTDEAPWKLLRKRAKENFKIDDE